MYLINTKLEIKLKCFKVRNCKVRTFLTFQKKKKATLFCLSIIFVSTIIRKIVMSYNRSKMFLRTFSIYYQLYVILNILSGYYALENGLARTPPMGWMSWNRFRCLVDCKELPNECISEKLMTNVADLLISEGYTDVGYEYVIVDDCWLANSRDEEGRLQPHRERFPGGIKALANYIHSRRLKFGIYENFGKRTCEGYPGSKNHLKVDANTFADWEVDYVKLDACFEDVKNIEKGYINFGRYLNKTGRPIVYSCSWPYYLGTHGIEPNLQKVGKYCNLWRNYHDIHDSWNVVQNIMEWFGRYQDEIAPHAGPGHWNDPDMLIIGNYGLSLDQSKTQMAIWAILAAPLIMSNDLSNMRPEFKAILQNRHIIAINQDKLGIQGRRIIHKDKKKGSGISVWLRPVSPVGITHSYAIAIVSTRVDIPFVCKLTLREMGLTNPSGYSFKELYNGDEFVLMPNATLRVRVNPTGVVFYKATVVQKRKWFHPET